VLAIASGHLVAIIGALGTVSSSIVSLVFVRPLLRDRREFKQMAEKAIASGKDIDLDFSLWRLRVSITNNPPSDEEDSEGRWPSAVS
jgi:hypothetical protein